MKEICLNVLKSLGIVVAVAAVIGLIWFGLTVLGWIAGIVLVILVIFGAYVWIYDIWTRKKDWNRKYEKK